MIFQWFRVSETTLLLSLGVLIDCDQRRIDYNIVLTSDISLVLRLHWMKHYYVDGKYFAKFNSDILQFSTKQ